IGTGISVPRFCSLTGSDSKQCFFKPVDCPLIELIGQVLGEQRAAHAVCGPLNWLGLPDPSMLLPRFQDLLATYRRAYDHINDLQSKIVDLHKKLNFQP